MSFVGLLVGAGFATGQEVVQYFTAFGSWGILGLIIAALIMTLAGTVFLQLGSYFHASEHNTVFRNVTHPIVSKLLDVAVIITLFAIGFVMLAGAGSNMEQQFGWKTWIGSTLMLVLVLIVGMLDVDKVSKVIGAVTPTIIIAVIGVAIYTGLNMPDDIGAAMDASSQIDTPIGNWLISALNYNGLALMLAVSMSLVIGGDNISPREAGWGGIVGGVIYSIMMGLAGFSLLMNSDQAQGSDIPMLSLVDSVNPTLGSVMAVIIYLMIFNTAIGMFYALGKRLTRNNPKRFYPVYAGACIIGFILSFVGFQALVSNVYPILGYLGLLMIVVMVFNRIKNGSKLSDESDRRMRAHELVSRRLDPRKRFTKKNERELRKLAAASNMETTEFVTNIAEEIHEELENDDDIEYDREDPEPSVTYVQHTKPEVPSSTSDLDFGKKGTGADSGTGTAKPVSED